MRYLVVVLLSLAACVSTPPYHTTRPLNYGEKALVNEITKEAQKSPRKDYYLSKLQDLLNTPEASPEETRRMIVEHTEDGLEKAIEQTVKGADKAGETIAKYTTREEWYEATNSSRHWVKRCPTFWGRIVGPCFQLVRDDVNDMLVHINIHLTGDQKQIEAIKAVEDNIEKHLSVPGFSVNVEFVERKGRDVFEIEIDPTKWPSSENWSGGSYLVYAHELGHVAFGLDDEYDRIKAHATNRYLPVLDRLELFLYQMSHPQPEDADQGIMSDPRKQLLPRHICYLAGLNVAECVKARTKQ